MYANTYGLPLSSWAQYEPRPMTTHLQPVKTPYEIVNLKHYNSQTKSRKFASQQYICNSISNSSERRILLSNTGENIYERRDWRWEGRYICGRKPDGRARYASVYGRSRTEVQTKMQEQLQTSASNSEPPGIGQSDLTVNQLFELFLKRATVKRSTYRSATSRPFRLNS